MKPRKNHSALHEWMDARVEAFIDEDLPEDEQSLFQQRMHDNPYWTEQVRRAERIRDELQALPMFATPEHLTESVLNQTVRARGNPSWVSRMEDRFGHWVVVFWESFQNPVVDYAVGVALIAVAAFFIVNPINPNGPAHQADLIGPTPAPPYTAAEIQQAQAEAKWTIAYVAEVSERTENTIQEDVLKEHVAKPMSLAIKANDRSTPSASSADASN